MNDNLELKSTAELEHLLTLNIQHRLRERVSAELIRRSAASQPQRDDDTPMMPAFNQPLS